MWKTIVVLAVLGIGALGLYIRLAPSDVARWHVDPLTEPVPSGSGWLLREGDGNGQAPQFAADPVDVLTALDAVALATPRTVRLAGSPEEGRITWVTRTRLMGFPDYTTAVAVSEPGGTRLVILARQRFGERDLGVNRARVEAWVAGLDLPQG
jgi:uncharacterized protein (DUF1499 family)